jgi:hypothetical protein
MPKRRLRGSEELKLIKLEQNRERTLRNMKGKKNSRDKPDYTKQRNKCNERIARTVK